MCLFHLILCGCKLVVSISARKQKRVKNLSIYEEYKNTRTSQNYSHKDNTKMNILFCSFSLRWNHGPGGDLCLGMPNQFPNQPFINAIYINYFISIYLSVCVCPSTEYIIYINLHHTDRLDGVCLCVLSVKSNASAHPPYAHKLFWWDCHKTLEKMYNICYFLGWKDTLSCVLPYGVYVLFMYNCQWAKETETINKYEMSTEFYAVFSHSLSTSG